MRKRKLTKHGRAVLRHVLLSKKLWDRMFKAGLIRFRDIHDYMPEKYWQNR